MMHPPARACRNDPRPIRTRQFQRFTTEHRAGDALSEHRNYDVILTSAAPGWPHSTLDV